MSTTLSAPASMAGRTFAQLPLSKPFREVCGHARALEDAYPTRFSLNGTLRDAPFIFFIYRGHPFRGEQRFDRLELSTDDWQCPERVAFEVASHFSWLLAPAILE